MPRLRSLGAERGINYHTEDFVEVVKAATGGKGVDVVLDMVGGDYVPREIVAWPTMAGWSIIAAAGRRQGHGRPAARCCAAA